VQTSSVRVRAHTVNIPVSVGVNENVMLTVLVLVITLAPLLATAANADTTGTYVLHVVRCECEPRAYTR
jgi:hypothetical protein